MFKNILIATDGSELAGKAVSNGLGLAKALQASVTIVTVTELWSAVEMASEIQSGHRQPIDDFEKRAAERAAEILSGAGASAKELGVACKTVHVPDQHPADGINATAEKEGCDLIIMASHGYRGVKKILLGSVANEVLAHAPVPVLIHR